MTAAVLGGALCLALAGCRGAGPEGPETVALDGATGAVLADATDRLADALDADDPCRALAEADALRERADAALAAGEAPESVIAETGRVVAAVTSGLACDEPVRPEALDPDAEVEAHEDATEDATEDEPAAEHEHEPATRDAPAPAPEAPVAPEDHGDRAPDEGDGGPPPSGNGGGASDGRGPDGQGPPGLRDGGPPGRGRG